MSHRLPLLNVRVAIAAVATLASLAAACAGGGGGGGTGPPPPPTSTPTPGNVATPLVGCPGGPPASVARRPLQTARIMFGKRFPTSSAYREPYIRGRVAVQISDNASAATSFSRLNARVVAQPNEFGYSSVSIPQSADPATTAVSLRNQPGISDARPIRALYLQVIPNDPDLGTNSQICTGPQTTFVQWDMYVTWMPEGWGVTTGSSSIVIGIVDTGVDLTNADVAGKVDHSVVYDLGTGVADGSASVQDHDGHGTNVSGIAASVTDNSTRFAGVGWNTHLVEARVFPTPSAGDPNPAAAEPDIAAGINWAVAHGAKVVNLSLGGAGACDSGPGTVGDAISAAHAAGVVVVAASGNDGTNSIDFPGDCPGALAVGATALDDTTNLAQPKETIASYSNSAPNTTWGVVAPGGDPSVAQQSCGVSPACDFLQWIINAYSTTAFMDAGTGILIAGTSQATPHVAGLASLMLAKDGTLTPTQIFSIIESNTDKIVGAGSRQGFGRINAIKALNATP